MRSPGRWIGLFLAFTMVAAEVGQNRSPAWGQSPSSGSALRKPNSSGRVTRSKKPADKDKKDEEEPPCPKPWPELTDEQQEKAIAKQKEFLDSLPAKLQLPALRYAETPRFLFATDLPPQQALPVLPSLEAMYKELCKAFGLDHEKNIWHGKATIIAFAHREAFQQFELKVYSEVPDKVQGLAHQMGNGEILISCYHGDDPTFFQVVIVHETTHGFMHRYRSRVHIPSWLNEGAADWVAGAVIRSSSSIRRRQSTAAAQIRQTRSLGGDFFYADHIRDVQYGMASSMTEFLLRTNPKGYRKLINGIKDGQTWQDSLKATYGFTPEELAFRYGVAIGVPGVTP